MANIVAYVAYLMDGTPGKACVLDVERQPQELPRGYVKLNKRGRGRIYRQMSEEETFFKACFGRAACLLLVFGGHRRTASFLLCGEMGIHVALQLQKDFMLNHQLVICTNLSDYSGVNCPSGEGSFPWPDQLKMKKHGNHCWLR